MQKQFVISKLLRISLLITPAGNPFFFAPVAIVNGWKLSEKVMLGMLGTELMKKSYIRENIAVLAGGRNRDSKFAELAVPRW
jgi:predicted methyltransferase MtxX (methanogen marker protein 4)